MPVSTKRKNIYKSKKMNKSKKMRGGSGSSGSSSTSSSSSSSSRGTTRSGSGTTNKRRSDSKKVNVKGKRWNAIVNGNNGTVYGFPNEPGYKVFTMQLGELAEAPKHVRREKINYNSLPKKQEKFLKIYRLLQNKNRQGVGRNKY